MIHVCLLASSAALLHHPQSQVRWQWFQHREREKRTKSQLLYRRWKSVSRKSSRRSHKSRPSERSPTKLRNENDTHKSICQLLGCWLTSWTGGRRTSREGLAAALWSGKFSFLLLFRQDSVLYFIIVSLLLARQRFAVIYQRTQILDNLFTWHSYLPNPLLSCSSSLKYSIEVEDSRIRPPWGASLSKSEGAKRLQSW